MLATPFAAATFDLIVSFDVISEASIDDARPLSEFARLLKPGGHLLLRLPAYSWLRGKHDEAVATLHRYTRPEIEHNLRQAGFTVRHASYANTILFPLAVVKRWSERFTTQAQHGSDLTLDPGPLNSVLRIILSAEAPLVRSIGLPFGLTVVTLAVKESE